MKKQRRREEKGITLVALVVTIIVLIILAGVSITMLIGENGIITQARKAKSDTEIEAEDEAQKLKEIADKINENLNSSKIKNFITTWRVNAGDTLMLPVSLNIGSNNFTVDWGDGTEETVSSEEGDLTDYPRHTYEVAGDYDITISGKCHYFTTYQFGEEYGNNPSQYEKLIALKSWGEIEAEKYEFTGCTNLSGVIPSPSENTFANFNDDMKYLFYDCEKITSIPGDLFSNIPDTVMNFKDTFYGCKGLTSIPENLFTNNTEITDFSYAFYRCKQITTIPDTIFDKNQKVTNFNFTFYGLDFITSAPALWERTGVSGTSCFGSCDALLALIEEGILVLTIPEDWLQSES